MAMGACPGQIPMPCLPPTLMATATMVRACRYKQSHSTEKTPVFKKTKFGYSAIFSNLASTTPLMIRNLLWIERQKLGYSVLGH